MCEIIYFTFRSSYSKIFLLLACQYLCLISTIGKLRVPSINKYDVWNNVVSSSKIHEVDKIARGNGLQHRVYHRNQFSPSNIIESTLHSILNTVQDNSPYVEYWWRDEWINLDAHADVDELLARDGGDFRYPTHGHVLYLNIGNAVRGPTVLFLNQYSQLVTVPAVTGRLLRFKGDMIHAVPRPSLAYFDQELGGSNHEIWTRIRRIEGEVSDETTINRRSVLLFNTWNKPPQDIPISIPNTDNSSSNSSAISSASDSSTISNTSKSTFSVKENESLSSISISQNFSICHPYNEWIPIATTTTTFTDDSKLASDNDVNIRIKVGLLGDKRRRGRASLSIQLYANTTSILHAFNASHDVYAYPIYEK